MQRNCTAPLHHLSPSVRAITQLSRQGATDPLLQGCSKATRSTSHTVHSRHSSVVGVDPHTHTFRLSGTHTSKIHPPFFCEDPFSPAPSSQHLPPHTPVKKKKVPPPPPPHAPICQHRHATITAPPQMHSHSHHAHTPQDGRHFNAQKRGKTHAHAQSTHPKGRSMSPYSAASALTEDSIAR